MFDFITRVWLIGLYGTLTFMSDIAGDRFDNGDWIPVQFFYAYRFFFKLPINFDLSQKVLKTIRFLAILSINYLLII